LACDDSLIVSTGLRINNPHHASSEDLHLSLITATGHVVLGDSSLLPAPI
jgi:hypothetical protein